MAGGNIFNCNNFSPNLDVVALACNYVKELSYGFLLLFSAGFG
jgi:hypothetical protein